jgi:SAM-dependent methyltransferase
MRSKNELIDDHFFRPRWYSIFINPYFIDRFTLFKAIKKFSKKIKSENYILDVGCGKKPYKKYFKTDHYFGIEIDFGGHANHAKEADAFYDGKNIPFDNESFDYILSTQVLEHVENPNYLVREMFRVLKINGEVLVTIPFVCNEHEQPFDFWRFTQFGCKKIMEEAGFKEINITPTCGIFSVVGQLFSSALFENLKIGSFLKILLTIFIITPIQSLSLFFDFIIRNRRLTLNYIIIAKKI